MTAPNEKLSVEVNGETHVLKMSYGLLTRLTDICSDMPVDGSASFAVDGAIRDGIIFQCLLKRGMSGFLEIDDTNKDISFDDLDMSVKTAEDVLDWALGHVTDFFMNRVLKGTEMIRPYLESTSALTSSINGSVG